jgi:hypothetical protein
MQCTKGMPLQHNLALEPSGNSFRTECCVTTQAVAPVLNCRALNPYVSSALGDWGKVAGGLTAHVPRAAVAHPAAHASPAAGAPAAQRYELRLWNDLLLPDGQ